MIQPIQVIYQVPKTLYEANQFLQSLPNLIACDFETAVKYTPAQLEQFKKDLENDNLSKLDRIALQSKLSATALDHPSHVHLTHFSVAWSESDAYVFVLDSPAITRLVLNFLTTTTRTQIWHNASFDFKHIFYHTGKFPLNYEDTQIRSKCLVNHVEIDKAKTGLKQLMGSYYGNWGISSDNFTLAQIHEPHVHHYAAIDACAVYKLHNHIENYLTKDS